MARDVVFSTNQAARYCHVSQQTIIRCCNSDELTHYRVPGSKFRRITGLELYKFMIKNKIPTEALLNDHPDLAGPSCPANS